MTTDGETINAQRTGLRCMKPVFRNPFEQPTRAQSVRARQGEASCATITVPPASSPGGPSDPPTDGPTPPSDTPGGIIPGVSDTLALGGGAALVLLILVVFVIGQ